MSRTPDWNAEARKLFRIEEDKTDGTFYVWLGDKLLEGNEYASALEGAIDDAAPPIAKALEAAYAKGREDADAVQPMSQEQIDDAQRVAVEKFGWGKPKRVELGCASKDAGCFCTGRCKRTAEEQEAHEKAERNFRGFFK